MEVKVQNVVCFMKPWKRNNFPLIHCKKAENVEQDVYSIKNDPDIRKYHLALAASLNPLLSFLKANLSLINQVSAWLLCNINDSWRLLTNVNLRLVVVNVMVRLSLCLIWLSLNVILWLSDYVLRRDRYKLL